MMSQILWVFFLVLLALVVGAICVKAVLRLFHRDPHAPHPYRHQD